MPAIGSSFLCSLMEETGGLHDLTSRKKKNDAVKGIQCCVCECEFFFFLKGLARIDGGIKVGTAYFVSPREERGSYFLRPVAQWFEVWWFVFSPP
jgi:hypothetical protein